MYTTSSNPRNILMRKVGELLHLQVTHKQTLTATLAIWTYGKGGLGLGGARGEAVGVWRGLRDAVRRAGDVGEVDAWGESTAMVVRRSRGGSRCGVRGEVSRDEDED